jgi:hypothetical protein
MNLKKRLNRLEVAKAMRPAHDPAATFAALVEALDRLAAAIVSGGEAEAKARRNLADMLVDSHP